MTNNKPIQFEKFIAQFSSYFDKGNECNRENNICFDDIALQKLTKQNVSKMQTEEKKAVIEDAKREFKCDSQKCVADRINVKSDVIFKPNGPSNSKEWLTNFDIESTFENLSAMQLDFGYFNCELSDFMETGSRNGDKNNICKTLPYPDENTGKKCYAIVLNTGNRTIGGVHWVSLFFDFRNENQWEVDFFDSAEQSFDQFKPIIEHYIADIKKESGGNKNILLKKNTVQHQHGSSECGVYSLFFCVARALGISFEEFNNNKQIFSDRAVQTLRSIFFT
jgi:hypothetical protein